MSSSSTSNSSDTDSDSEEESALVIGKDDPKEWAISVLISSIKIDFELTVIV